MRKPDCGRWVAVSEHHTIKITVEPEQVTGEFSCSAPVGADCRLGCGEQCAAWLNGDPCGHPRTHDEGFCLPITWLQEDDTYWYESYDGTLTTARSGPIVTRWDGDYYVWTYLDGPRPDVAGRCPACGRRSLFLAVGGHVTCRQMGCPDPCAADDLLHAGGDDADV